VSLAAELARALARPGGAAVPYADAAFPDRPVTVHAYRAPGHAPGNPCVLVQHGMGRNGDEYRDFWIAASDRHRLLILAPTFAEDAWPGPEHYNNGAVLAEDSAVRPPGRRAYDIPGRVLAAARQAGLTDARDVRLFGHSAGAQFAHRLVATGAVAPATVIAANAGWYTLPRLDGPSPRAWAGSDSASTTSRASLPRRCMCWPGTPTPKPRGRACLRIRPRWRRARTASPARTPSLPPAGRKPPRAASPAPGA
jgi:dienelactone hydrolase